MKSRGSVRRRLPCNGTRAFSLVELLLGCAVVATLIVLMFAGSGVLTERVHSLRCTDQLRSYHIHAMAYAADNNGAIAVLDKQGRQFQRFLPGYPTTYSLYPKWNCPAYVAMRKKQVEAVYPLGIWWTGYASNRFFADRSGVVSAEKRNSYQTPGTLSQITHPSKTPLYFDNNAMDPSAGDAAGGYIRDGAGTWYYAFWAAHQGGLNIVFFDGHVERVPFHTAGEDRGRSARDYPQFIWKPY